MPKDEVTLALDGVVSLRDLAQATSCLARLTEALATEVAPGVALEWTVSGLDQSSAIESAQCVALDPAQSEWVPRVILAHERFADAMEHRHPMPFKTVVAQQVADELRGLVRGRLIRVRFETADAGYTLAGARVVDSDVPRYCEHALGSVRGRVQTITNRASLRFTLYTMPEGKAVYCYLPEGGESEEKMRAHWGELVEVEGVVRRDPETGRPLTVRDVMDITNLRKRSKYSAWEAIGAAPGFLGAVPSEDIIRRTRDE